MAELCTFKLGDSLDTNTSIRIDKILNEADDKLNEKVDDNKELLSSYTVPIIRKCFRQLRNLGKSYDDSSLNNLTDEIYDIYIMDARPSLNRYITSKDQLRNILKGTFSVSNFSIDVPEFEFENNTKTKNNLTNVLIGRYGYADVARSNLVKDFRRNIIDSIIVDTIKCESVNTTRDVNNNIKLYKERLFSDIITYLQESGKPLITKNKNLYLPDSSVNEDLLAEVKVYTDNLLGENFNQSLVANTYSESLAGDKAAKLKMSAFNSYMILKNFDKFLVDAFNKSISIKGTLIDKMVTDDDGAKYSFSGLESNLLSGFDKKELADVSDTLDNITANIIGTRRFYKNGSDNPEPNKSLNLRDFNRVIGVLKTLTTYPNSELAYTISDIVNNPAQGYAKLFKLLFKVENDHTLIDKLVSEKIFSIQDRDIIYTIHKNFFDDNTPSSLYSIWKKDGSKYYNYITQFCNSLSHVVYRQYTYDLKDGCIIGRSSQESASSRDQRNFASSVNAYLDSINGDRYNKILEAYPITKTNNTTFNITVPLEGRNAIIKVGAKRAVNTIKIEDSVSNKPLVLDENDKVYVIRFLDAILNQDFEHKPDYLNIYNQKRGDTEQLKMAGLKDLMVLSSVYYTSLYFDREVLSQSSNMSDRSLRMKVYNQFGKMRKTATNGISNILYADISEPTVYQTISGLVDAYRDYSGESAKSFSTDAANKAIPNTVVTNLIDDTRHAIKIKTNSDPKNAAYGLTLGRIDKGVQRARDYSGGGVVKEVSDFTVDESFKSNFLYDYLANFIKYSTDPNIQTPIFAANPSDKSQVLKEMTDLSREGHAKYIKVKFNDLKTVEKKELLANVFGEESTAYRELSKIIDDYNKLSKTVPYEHTREFRSALAHKTLETTNKVTKNIFDFTPEELLDTLYTAHKHIPKKDTSLSAYDISKEAADIKTKNEELKSKVEDLQNIINRFNKLNNLYKDNELFKAIKDPNYVMVENEIVKPLYKFNSAEWRALYANEIGEVYSRKLNNILSDYEKLSILFNNKYNTDIAINPLDSFTEFNDTCRILGVKPKEVLEDLLDDAESSGNHIELIDNVHYEKIKGSDDIRFNRTIISQINRFNPTYFDFKGFDIKKYQLINNTIDTINNTFKKYYNADYNIFNKYFTVDKNGSNTFDNLYKYVLDSPGANAENILNDVIAKANAEGANIKPEDVYEVEYIGDYGGIIEPKQDFYDTNLIGGKFALTNIKDYFVNLTDADNFWKKKEFDLLQDLLLENITINTSNENGEIYLKDKVLQTLRNYDDGNWCDLRSNRNIGKTGKVILAKYHLFDNNGKPLGVFPIVDKSDVDSRFYNDNGKRINFLDADFDINNKNVNFTLELNPYLKLYNDTYSLVSEEFIISTIGTLDGHPYKKEPLETTDILEEANRRGGQVKRGAALTATERKFNKGIIDGIPDKLRVACIEEEFGDVYNTSGLVEKDGVDVINGATWTRGDISIMENNSLGGNSSPLGITKKSVAAGYHHKTANGIFWKTACYTMNNDKLKDGRRYQYYNKRMLEEKWKTDNTNTPIFVDENGKSHSIDLTVDYDGKSLIEPGENGYKDIYFKDENGDYIHRIIETRNADSTYRVNDYVVVDGVEGDTPNSHDISITSSYDLWQLFGGMNSAHLENNGMPTTFQDNTSFINLAIAENRVGLRKEGFKTDNNSTESVILPLKDVGVHYIVTHEALKQGAANINTQKRLNNPNKRLLWFYIDPIHFGIQLTKEKAASEEDVAMISQGLNAMASRGFTTRDAHEMYMSLRSLVNSNLKDFIEGFDSINDKNDKTPFMNAVVKVLTSNIMDSQSDDLSMQVTLKNALLKLSKDGKKFTYENTKGIIPFSSPMLYNKFVSSLSVYMSKKGIRQRMFGQTAVLNPSHGFIKMHGGKKLSEWGSEKNLLDAQIAYEQDRINNIKPFDTISDVNMESNYKIYNGERFLTMEELRAAFPEARLSDLGGATVELSNQIIYKALKRFLKDNPDYHPVHNMVPGDELHSYRLKFTGTHMDENNQSRTETYNMYDLDIIDARWECDHELKNDLDILYDDMSNYYKEHSEDIKKELHAEFWKDEQNVAFSTLEGRMAALDNTINNVSVSDPDLVTIPNVYNYSELINKYNSRLNQFLVKWQFLIGDNVPTSHIALQKLLMLKQQETLNALGVGYEKHSRLFKNFFTKGIRTEVYVNGGIKINVDKVDEVQPYECIASCKYLKELGLKPSDTLSSVRDDKYFFLRRMLNNWGTKVSEENYDIELKNFNGNHIYLSYKDLDRPFLSLGDKIDLDLRGDDKSGYTRYNDNGEATSQQFSSKDDYIRVDPAGNEVIFTDNPEFYLSSYKYNAVRFSKTFNNRPDAEILSKVLSILDIDHKAIGFFKKTIGIGKSKDTINMAAFKKLNTDLDDSMETLTNEVRDNAKVLSKTSDSILEGIISSANSVRNSFEETLNALAARIPCQTMQSVMAMKIAAFDNYDTNNVLVSHFQIWLQGSDYDIDTIAMMMYSLGHNGEFVGWSKYFNAETREALKASMQFPYPSGKRIELVPIPADKLEGHPDVDVFERLAKDKESMAKVIAEHDNSEEAILLKSDIIRFYEDGKLEYIDTPENRRQARLIANMIDSHNMFMENKNTKYIELANKNFTTSKMISISNNPRHLVQGQTSIDSVIDYIKEIANRIGIMPKGEENTPGNIMASLKAGNNAISGTKGTGIMAAGIKDFFGLTQYFNNKIRDPKLRAKYDRLVINKTILGKTFRLLANTRYEGELTDKKILDDLATVDQTRDASLEASGLLALSTDNTKEPTLFKINANDLTLGLYVYGISLGLGTEEIANIMISPLALKLVQMTRVNVFEGTGTFTLKRALISLNKGLSVPYTKLSSGTLEILRRNHLYGLSKDKDGKEQKGTINIYTGLDNFSKAISEYADSYRNNKEKSSDFRVRISEADSKFMLQLKDYYESLMMIKYKARSSKDAKNQSKSVYEFSSTYKDLKTLVMGSEELKTLTKFFGLNKGLETTPYGQLDAYIGFRDIIKNRLKDIENIDTEYSKSVQEIKPALDKLLGKDREIDMHKYFDSEDSTYREAVIDIYDKIKHSYNVLDVLNDLPQYNGYLQTLYYDVKAQHETFAKFRFIEDYYPKMKEAYSATTQEDKARIYRALAGVYDMTLMKSFLVENRKTASISKGSMIYSDSGIGYAAKQDLEILLGTDNGNATFSKWMVDSAIPELKELYPNNKFIADLTMTSTFKDTLSGKERSIYTLNTPMLPNKYQEEEKNKLMTYKSAFNDLRNTPAYMGRNIQDLFYLYNLINFGEEVNKSSMSPIFESMRDRDSIAKEFLDYTIKLEGGGDLKEDVDFTINDLVYACAPMEKTTNTKAPFTKDYNPTTRKMSIYRRLTSSEKEDRAEQRELYYDTSGDVEGEDAPENYISDYQISDDYAPINNLTLSNKSFFNTNYLSKPVVIKDIIDDNVVRFDANIFGKVNRDEDGKVNITEFKINDSKYTPIISNDKIIGIKDAKGNKISFTDKDGQIKKVDIGIRNKILVTELNKEGFPIKKTVLDTKLISDSLNDLFNDPCK